MNILVMNCGSSSLKYQLIDSESENVLAKGLCERIGIDGRLTHKPANKEKYVVETTLKDHNDAVKLVMDTLMDQEHGVISDINEISAVGHRVLHGGKFFSDSIIINEEVKDVIKACFELGPLHNPANLIGIEACEKIMPNTPQVAVFDTAFHQTMPAKAYMYGIPYEYYDKYNIRKYGFHGTSHSFVSKRAIEIARLDKDNSKVIVCHLGNGASISAVENGKSIDTSMGLTPLEGLIMGTRSGDIDPTVIQYIAHKENKTLEEVLNILNKKSGVLGLSEYSSDFRDILKRAGEGEEKATLALDAFVYRIVKYIGSYIAAMNGVDAIAFTAGLGENNAKVRNMICSSLAYVGVELDQAANEEAAGVEKIISSANSKVKVMAIPTNEELAIARETVALI
ncbi:MAG: acetate kinase [Lachnospiraceae bacterium]|nr:acetate kinase [Lachnospiraceae bacterium]